MLLANEKWYLIKPLDSSFGTLYNTYTRDVATVESLYSGHPWGTTFLAVI